MTRFRDRLRRWTLLLALLPAGTMVGCLGLESVDVQKAVSSGLQATANGIIGMVLKAWANALVGLPANPV